MWVFLYCCFISRGFFVANINIEFHSQSILFAYARKLYFKIRIGEYRSQSDRIYFITYGNYVNQQSNDPIIWISIKIKSKIKNSMWHYSKIWLTTNLVYEQTSHTHTHQTYELIFWNGIRHWKSIFQVQTLLFRQNSRIHSVFYF